jgi:hypothetical protein
MAYECPRLADPSRDLTDSKISVSFIAIADLISFISYVVLMDDEVSRLVSCLFNKSPVTKRPVSVPAPYYSKILLLW